MEKLDLKSKVRVRSPLVQEDSLKSNLQDIHRPGHPIEIRKGTQKLNHYIRQDHHHPHKCYLYMRRYNAHSNHNLPLLSLLELLDLEFRPYLLLYTTNLNIKLVYCIHNKHQKGNH